MKKVLKKYKIRLLFGIFLLGTYTGVNTWSPTYGTNQIITHADLLALQTGSKIAWKSTPTWTSTDGTGASYADVNTYVTGCSIAAGSHGTSQLATFGQVQACAVTSTTVSALNDAWLASTTTYWTATGSGTFVANTSISGSPSNTQWYESATGSTNTSTIKQSISPTSIVSGTKLYARAYVADTIGVESTGNACSDNTGTGSQTGAATVEITNSTGTVMASASATSTAMTQITVSYTVATTGQYYVVGSVTTRYEAYNYDGALNPTTQVCPIYHGVAQGQGYITGLSIANS